MTNYYQLAGGKFFSFSKDPKEGYEKHVTKTGKESYRKYVDSLTGVLDSVSVRNNERLQGNPQEISVSVKDENGDNHIFTTFLMFNKDYANVVESLIKQMGGLKKGEVFTFSPFDFTTEEGRRHIGISIKDSNGEKLPKLTQSYSTKDGEVVAGDIPKIDWVVSPRTGKPEANSDNKFIYLKSVLDKALVDLAWGGRETSQTTSEAPKAKATAPKISQPVPTTSNDDDDLPF